MFFSDEFCIASEMVELVWCCEDSIVKRINFGENRGIRSALFIIIFRCSGFMRPWKGSAVRHPSTAPSTKFLGYKAFQSYDILPPTKTDKNRYVARDSVHNNVERFWEMAGPHVYRYWLPTLGRAFRLLEELPMNSVHEKSTNIWVMKNILQEEEIKISYCESKSGIDPINSVTLATF